MAWAHPLQNFQDWFTQQWVIIWGKKIKPESHQWLTGPYGKVGGIGTDIMDQLIKKEQLVLGQNTIAQGLIPSFEKLSSTKKERERLQPEVIDFYENTSNYHLKVSLKWNPFFRIFGRWVNLLFSNRINQLYIPVKDIKEDESICSEIITLCEPTSGKIKYTIWLRTLSSTGRIIYSGIYDICQIPSGEKCVKAIFPLPNGNATVIMRPIIDKKGGLILESSGKKFGDAGFYFLLHDSKENHYAQYLRSFRDKLHIRFENGNLIAEQVLTLWHLKVLHFKYHIHKKTTFSTPREANKINSIEE